MVIPMPKKVKIDLKTIDCIFIGYIQNNNIYQFLVHESKILDIHENMIMESRNVSFSEHVFPYRSKDGASSSK